MHILITGGLGFIGSHFIRHYLNAHPDSKITNLDLLTYAANLHNLDDLQNNPNYKFIKGDVRDAKVVEQIFSKDVDIVVHFAAQTHVDRSIAQPGDFVLTDVYGTYVLLDQTLKRNLKKIVLVSTDEVYGSIEKGSFNENDRLDPSSPYSASKAAADLLALSFYKTYGIPVVITRSTNNYGPYQHPEKFIPKMVLRAFQQSSLPLYGDGAQKRDWIYVKDNCNAIDLVSQLGCPGEIYNIGASNEVSNLEIAKLVLREMGKPESLISFVSDRPSHDRRYSLDSTKISKLGWKTQYVFEDALSKTIQWYMENQNWWIPLVDDHFVKSDTPWIR